MKRAVPWPRRGLVWILAIVLMGQAFSAITLRMCMPARQWATESRPLLSMLDTCHAQASSSPSVPSSGAVAPHEDASCGACASWGGGGVALLSPGLDLSSAALDPLLIAASATWVIRIVVGVLERPPRGLRT